MHFKEKKQTTENKTLQIAVTSKIRGLNLEQ